MCRAPFENLIYENVFRRRRPVSGSGRVERPTWVMPDWVRANTNATIMMIGERVADFIKAGR